MLINKSKLLWDSILYLSQWLRSMTQMIVQGSKDEKQEHSSSRAVMAHSFNHSTWVAEAGGFLSSKPDWSCERVSRTAQGYTEKPCLQTNKQTNKDFSEAAQGNTG